MLILSLASLVALVSLSAYFLWLQRRSHNETIRVLQQRDTDLLDRLMFTTGNQGYVRAKSQEIQAEPTDEEKAKQAAEAAEWREL